MSLTSDYLDNIHLANYLNIQRDSEREKERDSDRERWRERDREREKRTFISSLFFKNVPFLNLI